MIEQLNQEWKDLRVFLKEQRKLFDNEWRNHNKDHECKTKVYAYNGEWFCKHLTNSRNKQFKEKFERIDEIISLMVSTTK